MAELQRKAGALSGWLFVAVSVSACFLSYSDCQSHLLLYISNFIQVVVLSVAMYLKILEGIFISLFTTALEHGHLACLALYFSFLIFLVYRV